MRTKGDIILLSSPLRLSTASLPSPFSIPSLSTPATALPLLCSAAAPLNSRSEWQATKNQQLQTAVFYDNNQQQTMNHQKQKQTIATPNAVPTSGIIDSRLPTGRAKPIQYLNAAKLACNTKVKDIKSICPNIDERSIPSICMDFVYEYTLLVDDLKIGRPAS